jgi:hypothetical protein
VASLIVASTDGDYPSGATYGGPPKTLMTETKNFPGTNTLAYFAGAPLTGEKFLQHLDQIDLCFYPIKNLSGYSQSCLQSGGGG